ncbi:uncharacterized protein V1516DRAFT_696979 [Lipomyces oligophaga]|uniref:uncharacterized protein n=1 Tax=Lipomyces oligophaga TaxID=45792 RepID=UPI0034CE1B91
MSSSPLMQISIIAGSYLVFDIEVVKEIRDKHHISGILAGTLPQIPQQNVFLGLPLQLLPEEAALLVQDGYAEIVDDEQTFSESACDPNSDDITVQDTEVEIKVAELEQSLVVTQGTTNFYTTPTAAPPPSRVVVSAPSAMQAIWTSPRYHAYKYLHSKGFFLSPGLRFGGQFLAYPGDPLRYHSHYLVRGLSLTENFPLLDLVGSGRLGTGIKKAWLVGASLQSSSDPITQDDDNNSDHKYASFCIEWAGFG